MRCCKEETEGQKLSKLLDIEINKDRVNILETVQILLLGTGECGKTTIIKQMKLIHDRAQFDKEIDQKRREIRDNIHEAIHTLVTHITLLNIRYESVKCIQSAEFIKECGLDTPEINEAYLNHVKLLWLDGGIQKCYRRSSDFQLLDCAKYFLDRVDVICDPNYTPTDDDILNSRKVTKEISEIEFYVPISRKSNQRFIMIDVGGQRDQRGKWVKLFHGIDAVLFVTSCSDFDQGLRENPKVNRLKESLNVFKNMWQNPFLRFSGFLLFLNKQDLLERKVREGKSIQKLFPEYLQFDDSKVEKLDKNVTMLPEANRHRCFIRQKFMDIALEPFDVIALNRIEKVEPRKCYFHFTVATNTENVRTVFNACQSIILATKLKSMSL